MQKKTRNGHEGKQASSAVELSKWPTDEEETGLESNFQSASDLLGSRGRTNWENLGTK